MLRQVYFASLILLLPYLPIPTILDLGSRSLGPGATISMLYDDHRWQDILVIVDSLVMTELGGELFKTFWSP